MTVEFSKKILVGATEDEIVVLRLTLYEREGHTYELSFSGDCYSRRFFDDDSGEVMAWDMINDSGIWEDAVHDHLTEDSKSDYYEKLIQADGWEQVVGDVEYLDKCDLYTQMTSGGQIDMHITIDKFQLLAIEKTDLEFVFSCWKKYHLNH